MEEIIEKWEISGLLDNIEDQKIKERIALHCDAMAKLMTEMTNNIDNYGLDEDIGKALETATFPIIRRLVLGGLYFETSDIFRYIIDYFEKNYETFKNELMGTHPKCDPNFEFVVKLCDELISGGKNINQ